LIKNLGLPKDEHATVQAFKREHKTLQNRKFLRFIYFCGSFFPSWIRTRIPNADPDPADQNTRVKMEREKKRGREQGETKTFLGKPQNFHSMDLGMIVG
jgi:hypothetical protein